MYLYNLQLKDSISILKEKLFSLGREIAEIFI